MFAERVAKLRVARKVKRRKDRAERFASSWVLGRVVVGLILRIVWIARPVKARAARMYDQKMAAPR